ncbi:hypothetical protein [Couchioplanes azureus]|uniref:hypothetical protein n=1 Tax=Couchioplanes caeruleus TaxID=56438 RepID=UPI0016713BEF|nr:hypothetical protein [Couchioplanes caeruleus]GGQ85306.1 hypothetical protein GCM10010166_64510 [Couchioplanes caeruleus subsp. azureus]
MGVERQARRAWHATLLTLVLGAAWIALFGVGRGGWSPADELPRPAAVAAVPHSVTPVLPEARPAGKLLHGALVLFVASIVAFLLGARRRVRWPAAAGATSAATPSTLLHAMRGRAPPRLPA